MKNVPWWIAVILLVALIAFLVTGIISGFNEIVKFGITVVIGAIVGLAIPQPTISNKSSPSASEESIKST